MKDISPEVFYRTARSGGKGGQNVNKVETMAEACWAPAETHVYDEEEKARIIDALAHKINKEGLLTVRSSATRSQLENKAVALEKLQALVAKSLERKAVRKATRPSKAAKEKRLTAKKLDGVKKESRRKYKGDAGE
jgi:ribosome-associated protein